MEQVERLADNGPLDSRASHTRPVERSRRHRLRAAVDRHRVVQLARSQSVAQCPVDRIGAGARIDQQAVAANAHRQRKGIGMSVPAIHEPVPARVEHEHRIVAARDMVAARCQGDGSLDDG
jgi:hypothetical protein